MLTFSIKWDPGAIFSNFFELNEWKQRSSQVTWDLAFVAFAVMMLYSARQIYRKAQQRAASVWRSPARYATAYCFNIVKGNASTWNILLSNKCNLILVAPQEQLYGQNIQWHCTAWTTWLEVSNFFSLKLSHVWWMPRYVT